MITFLQGGVLSIFKYSESMLISMGESVMSKVGSNKAETSACFSEILKVMTKL